MIRSASGGQRCDSHAAFYLERKPALGDRDQSSRHDQKILALLVSRGPGSVIAPWSENTSITSLSVSLGYDIVSVISSSESSSSSSSRSSSSSSSSNSSSSSSSSMMNYATVTL